jgi:YidC/Oxa1 family membrane protein insertase
VSTEKRVFLAIFLSFGLLAVYQTYFAPPPPMAPQASAPTQTTTPGAPIAPTGTPAQAAPTLAVPPDASARDIVVETDSVRAVFTTQGATLKSWQLLKYKADKEGDGKPLELIPGDLPPNTVRPFTLTTDDEKLTATLAAAVYQPSIDHLTLGSEPGTLTFQLQGADGLNARKTFYFQPDRQPYVLNTEFSVDQAGSPKPFTVNFGPAVGTGQADGRTITQAIHFLDGSVTRIAAADVQAQPRHQGAMRYAGVEDHYFLAAALPASDKSQADYAALTFPASPDGTTPARSLISFALRPNPGAAPTQTVAIKFFLGPKDFDHLRGADVQLTRAIDFGWFAQIVVPLLQSLKWINGYVGNYGIAIIVLTILINILIFPLRHRSMVSMKKMQSLQPQIKAIQDRYAKYKMTDPERQKMNPEMMALYKQKGVNPASGCIPMLLTFPILLAFYNLLNSAIELRGAMFIPGWINDLSLQDPTYVWPILMGATMFWQQKMTPSTADPMQQKIFLLMPVVFTVMFLTMPSGLVVYWLTSNILTIGQQYLTNHLITTSTPRKA